MATRQPHKVSTVFYAIFNDAAGRSQSDYAAAFYKNNALQSAPAFTISEVSTGLYAFAFTPASTGTWHVNLVAAGAVSSTDNITA